MFRNIKYITAVYETGSFSAAAKKLYITQPCLSAMVKKTEDKLGVKIFDRNSKPLQLTEHGKQYFHYYEKINNLEQEFENYLNDVRGLHTGTLSIGTNNVFASYVLPTLIVQFNSLYPDIQVKMFEGNIFYLSEALENGNLDLVIDNCHLDSKIFTQRRIGNEHLLLAAHRSTCCHSSVMNYGLTHTDIIDRKHLTAKKQTVSIKPFTDIPFIALRPGNDTRKRMDRICEQENVNVNVNLEVDQLATAFNIACNQLGATLVSDTLLYNTTPNNDMLYYKLSNDASSRDIYLYNKRRKYLSAAAKTFINMAKDFYHKY